MINNYPAWLVDKDYRIIFDATLNNVKRFTPEKVEMLAAYSEAVVEMVRAEPNSPSAVYWRLAMEFARNGLGFGKRVFVDYLEILIDSPRDITPWQHLNSDWQLQERERPKNWMPISMDGIEK